MEDRQLINLIRKSLDDYFQGKEDPPMGGKTTGEGVFVTLHKQGALRGCIGCLEGDKPVEWLIYDYARSAAFKDPRFPPLEKSELNDLELEITLLSPFEKVKDIKEIKIGTHGLYLRLGYRSGLFLPQVPVEQNWDLEEYLYHLCGKAGLPGGSWQEKGAELMSFTGRIIGQ